jgi:hypothetical protein
MDELGRRMAFSSQRMTRRPKFGANSSGGGRIQAMGGDIVAAKSFSRKQALYNEKAAQYAKAGVITTPSYLRLELTANTVATSVLNFNTLDTSGTKTVTERRLKLNDTFTITDIAFYIIADTAATVNAPTDSQRAKARMYTYPNPTVAAIGATADDLEAIYNGFLSLRIDSTTFIDSLPMRQFYRVGTSQAGYLGGTGGVAIARDEWPLMNYGRAELLPSIELNGQANIEWSISLPTAQTLGAPADNFIAFGLILNGFLNQGAASVQQQLQGNLRKGAGRIRS